MRSAADAKAGGSLPPLLSRERQSISTSLCNPTEWRIYYCSPSNAFGAIPGGCRRLLGAGGRLRRRQQQGHDFGQSHLQGAPVPSGTLNLYPASGPPFPISLKPDGTFSVSDVPIGQVGVAIDTPPPMIPPAGTDMSKVTPHVAIPAKYKDPKTSGLTWEIKGGKNTKDFELTD